MLGVNGTRLGSAAPVSIEKSSPLHEAQADGGHWFSQGACYGLCRNKSRICPSRRAANLGRELWGADYLEFLARLWTNGPSPAVLWLHRQLCADNFLVTRRGYQGLFGAVGGPSTPPDSCGCLREACMIVDSFLPNTLWKGVPQAENMRMIRNPDHRVWVLRTFFKILFF